MDLASSLSSTENNAAVDSLNSKRKGEVLTYVTNLETKAKQNRLQFEREWYMNLAFYFGKHYVQWTTELASLMRLHVPKAPPWRVRLVANKIRPIIRTELAKVIQEHPQAFVVPASTDEEDINAARAGEQIFEHLFRELSMNRVTRRAMFWTMLCGTSFMKDWYDSKKKDGTGQMGKISCEAVSPFHILVPDTQEEELENQPFVIHALAKSEDYIKTRFGQSVSKKVSAGSDLMEQKFLSAIGINNKPRDYVAVREAWIKPCSKFKEGAVVLWADDTLLNLHEGWPYDHDEFPFSKFDHIPTGRFYADSTIPDLVPLQKEYNRTRSQIIEAKNRMSKPQLMAVRGSVDPNKMTSEPGLIVFYGAGYAPPQPIPLQSIPSYVIEELDRTQRDMDDISSQHEVTKGRTPPGVTAATAIAYLQEQDDSKLAATVSSLEEGVERIGVHFLSHVKQFWNAQRRIKVLGEDRMFESYLFSKSSIKGNTDLRIESGSATPRSRAAKQAFLMELGKMGWLPPDRILRYLDMAETGKMYDELQLDGRQAKRENLKMSKLWQQYLGLSIDEETREPNGTLEANSWDNHEIHIIEHDNFRKRQAFEALPEEAKIVFEQHVQLHRQAIMMNQGLMPMEGGMLPGGDPQQVNTGQQQNGQVNGQGQGAVSAENFNPPVSNQEQTATE